jgi:hypothetical protein
MPEKKAIVPLGKIEQRILLIRGEKVIVDADLAGFYGVTTKVLNQAVRRNIGRFPDDFMFQLEKSEKQEVVTNCDHLENLKYSPEIFSGKSVGFYGTRRFKCRVAIGGHEKRGLFGLPGVDYDKPIFLS